MRADIGIALDGDADRVLIVDEKGHLVDGDQLMAVIAESWQRRRPAVASPASSPRSCRTSASSAISTGIGLSLARTAVGDRYVLERMREHGYNLGGEQSGHIILSDYATTGDGLVAALQVLAVVQAARQAGERGLPPLRAAAAGPEERALHGRQAARRHAA